MEILLIGIHVLSGIICGFGIYANRKYSHCSIEFGAYIMTVIPIINTICVIIIALDGYLYQLVCETIRKIQPETFHRIQMEKKFMKIQIKEIKRDYKEFVKEIKLESKQKELLKELGLTEEDLEKIRGL